MRVKELPKNPKKIQDSIIVCIWDGPLDPLEADLLQVLRHQGNQLIVEGKPENLKSLDSGWAGQIHWRKVENPYAGLAWKLPNRRPLLMAPQGWGFAAARQAPEGVRALGQLLAVFGERQTPSNAVLKPLHAPVGWSGRDYIYLNGKPFAAFQAWLQGQEDLLPWLNWRSRLFWLDEWVTDLTETLSQWKVPLHFGQTRGNRKKKTFHIILRHDLDHSKDTSYLDEEVKQGIPATHGVLKDENMDFWIKKLNPLKNHETVFHYETAERCLKETVKARWRGNKECHVKPAAQKIAGRGLEKQVWEAKKLGLEFSSLTRHRGFLLYPEWIDALDYVYGRFGEITASSSMFRGSIMRWGVRYPDSHNVSVWHHPDCPSPFWWPFKIAHAGIQGKILPGWEFSCFMETEVEHFQKIVKSKLPNLPKFLLTIIYHPAHSKAPTFYNWGSLANLRKFFTKKKRAFKFTGFAAFVKQQLSK